MLYRFVQIQETVNLFPVVQMVGNGTEAVILRDGRKIVFPVVLPECAVIPYHTSFLIPSAGAGLVYDLVQCRSHTHVFFLFHRLRLKDCVHPGFSVCPTVGI